jgi:hypothetical protein
MHAHTALERDRDKLGYVVALALLTSQTTMTTSSRL